VDALAAVQGAVARVEQRVDRLRGTDGRTQVRSDRLRSLAGTRFESGILGALGSGGVDALQRAFDLGTLSPTGTTGPTDATPADVLDPAVLNALSPFRGHGPDVFAPEEAYLRQLERHHMCPVNAALLRSRYWEYWAEAFRGRSTAEASIRMQQLYARMVQHHELGHSLGLRHNFAASLDRDHYGDGWFRVAFGDDATSGDELLLPRYADFDATSNGGDGDGFVGPGEVERYLAELRRVRNERAARGAHNHSSSSTMDYSGDTGDAQGLGRYDVAAVVWNYFDMVEGFVGDAEVSANDSSDRLRRSDVTPRVWFRSYAGGDACRVDGDCPASAESSALGDQPITQRCVRNTREVPLQLPCAGATACVCSSFDADFQDYVDGAAYDSDEDGDGEPDFTPVRYLFCADERTDDISWCTRYDAGESFQESIDHARRSWLESYGPTYYRRFRRGGARSGGATGAIIDAAKIYQHLFFRLNFEPGFRSNERTAGPRGPVLRVGGRHELVHRAGELAGRGQLRARPGHADLRAHRERARRAGLRLQPAARPGLRRLHRVPRRLLRLLPAGARRGAGGQVRGARGAGAARLGPELRPRRALLHQLLRPVPGGDDRALRRPGHRRPALVRAARELRRRASP
jgi:hypothetical protein